MAGVGNPLIVHNAKREAHCMNKHNKLIVFVCITRPNMCVYT